MFRQRVSAKREDRQTAAIARKKELYPNRVDLAIEGRAQRERGELPKDEPTPMLNAKLSLSADAGREPERWVVAGNVVQDGAFRHGAKVLVLNIPGNQVSVRAWGVSKGGRLITKWIQSAHLTNLRPAFLASRAIHAVRYWPTKEGAAAEIAARFPPKKES